MPELQMGADASQPNLLRLTENYYNFPTSQDLSTVMGNLLDGGNQQALSQLLGQQPNAAAAQGKVQNP